MAAPKRKQEKTSSYPVASKKPKFGKESDKLKKSAGKKDAEISKSKKPLAAAKTLPKRTALSVESDSDELEDEAFEEIKDDGSDGEEEGDDMDIDEVPKETENGQSGCGWSSALPMLD